MKKILLFALHLLQISPFSFESCTKKSYININLINSWWKFTDEILINCYNYYTLHCSNVVTISLSAYGSNAGCLIISESNMSVFGSISDTPPSFYSVQLDSNFINTFEKDAFKNIKNLQELSARDNNITMLPDRLFILNSNLKIVDLSYNNINYIGNSTFPDSTEYLNLMQNKLQKLDFYLPDSLINLEISFNMISHIVETSFQKTTKLHSLNLRNNRLTTLSPVLFTSNKNFIDLDLSHNNISVLSMDIFKSVQQMERLNLLNNTLQSLNFILPASLTDLDLSSNSLSFVDKKTFLKTTKLSTLYLNNILLKALPAGLFDQLNHLNKVYLEHNNITSVPEELFTANHNLKYLSLHDNNIQKINFNLPKSLIDLDLSYNSISSINVNSFNDLNTLTHLKLNNNLLQKLPVGCFHLLNQLESLDLSHNRLMITYGTFRGLTNLETLHLANNSIVDLPEPVLNDLKNLSSLDVSYNLFSTLNVRDLTVHLNHLRSIRLEENPFKCSYLIELIAQFKSTGVQVEEGHNFFEKNVNGIGCIHDDQEVTSAADDNIRRNQENAPYSTTDIKQFVKEIISEFNMKWSNRSEQLQRFLEEKEAKEDIRYKDGYTSIFQTILLFGVLVTFIVAVFIKYTKHKRNRRVLSLTEMHSLGNIQY